MENETLNKKNYFNRIKEYFLALIKVIGILIGIYILLGLVTFIFSIIYALVFRTNLDSMFINNNICSIQAIMQIFMVIILYYLFRDSGRDFLEFCKFKKLKKKEILDIVEVSFGLKIIIGIISSFIFYSFFSNMGTEALDKIYQAVDSSFGAVISVVIIGPIYEEIIFRGICLNFLNKRIGIVSTIVIQAILFGIVHGNMRQFIYATILGIILGIFVIYTESIYSSMIVHIIGNGLSVIISLNENVQWVQNITLAIMYLSTIVLIFKSIHIIEKIKERIKPLK